MGNGIRLGRIFGIELNIDYSWFFVFALVTFLLAFSILPQLVPGLSAATYITVGLVTSLLFFGSVLFHELAHSLVAKANGIGIEGITLMLFGGVSQVKDEPKTAGVEFRMTLVGPLSSIILGVVLLALLFGTRGVGLSPIVTVPVLWLGYINVVLGIFNLLPGFPMDGGRLIRSAIWYFTGNLRLATSIAATLGKGFAYLLILGGIAGPFLTGNFGFIWLALLGWYLSRAAEAEYQRTMAQHPKEEEDKAA